MSESVLKVQVIRAFNTFTRIGQESSSNAKQAILSEEKDNKILKAMLLAAYSPFIQYNIKKIPVEVSDCTGINISGLRYMEFERLLIKLSNREITGNAAIKEVADFLKSCSPEEYLWYTRIISKDLRIGIADKGINKVIKGAVPIYEVMLADKIQSEDLNLDTPKALKMLPDRMVVQYKIDGYRLNIFVPDNGEVLIRTRNGKVVKGYNDLEKEATGSLPKGYVYDGELVVPELFEWISENVKQSGNDVLANRDLFSEVMSHAFSKEEDKQGVFNVFDMVKLDEWQTQDTKESYEVRLQRMKTMLAPIELKHIMVVPTSRVYLKSKPEDLQEIVSTFHHFLAIGWEGLMIKNLDTPYEFKRTKNLLKMKLMDTLDLEVIELFEGTGKYTGMMGGVFVDYKGNKVGVGSGWNDEQRKYYWDNPSELIGKTIEVLYQAETKNKHGGLSLSFPVVKRIRSDK